MREVQVPLGGRHSAHCVEEAEEIVKELRAALAHAGITLPSLRIDPASLAREAPVRSSNWVAVPSRSPPGSWRPCGEAADRLVRRRHSYREGGHGHGARGAVRTAETARRWQGVGLRAGRRPASHGIGTSQRGDRVRQRTKSWRGALKGARPKAAHPGRGAAAVGENGRHESVPRRRHRAAHPEAG